LRPTGGRFFPTVIGKRMAIAPGVETSIIPWFFAFQPFIVAGLLTASTLLVADSSYINTFMQEGICHHTATVLIELCARL
jgi:hypothetical protein